MKQAIAFLLFLFCAASVSAQTEKQNQAAEKPHPDFSGRWVLESENSIAPGPLYDAEILLQITHRDPELKIVRVWKAGVRPEKPEGQQRWTQVFTFYTDRRGEPDSFGCGFKVHTESRWNGRKIESDWSGPALGGGFPYSHTAWELSKDGEALTRTIACYGGGLTAEFKVVQVYKKTHNKTGS